MPADPYVAYRAGRLGGQLHAAKQAAAWARADALVMLGFDHPLSQAIEAAVVALDAARKLDGPVAEAAMTGGDLAP